MDKQKEIKVFYKIISDGCRSRDRTLSMASNRPERIYSIYNPDTIKKDDEDNNNRLGGKNQNEVVFA